MSLDINWEEIKDDPNLVISIKESLNDFIESIHLPSYVNNLQIKHLNLGETGPNIILRQITDPLEDFYKAIRDEQDVGNPGHPSLTGSAYQQQTLSPIEDPNKQPSTREDVAKAVHDIQCLAELEYVGDLSLTLTASLTLNYPSTNFVTLPIKLKISGIQIHSLCLLAYLSNQLFVSILCDINDPIIDNREFSNDSFNPIFANKNSLERISIIRNMKIETEIGQEYQGEGSVLKSIGQLEELLLEKLKTFLRNELAWPNWLNLDFNDESDLEEDHH
ncbi:hypothetical protein TBLA_0B00510 [Henningerozyma blattae CBS 6284]|uniref:Mitochondrial distribution and morphology protein 12 n=1 Tax=Henningerozyma blattae (strain ATCC 34711 / CBS 6284 / DSM 70876 / NBRC 10599 / NRRL Y-10934 / UCD 77-7) TaxID=1071380 RepID=I2GXP3_HENB6|nr:hypothetical protein TBLA_0B00510 [Tetrapisispora blattae CBS 6284]CCH58895.1 hypothetical protein TBLA_0B00510 [Tetrapisispora blattae CBS 6284]